MRPYPTRYIEGGLYHVFNKSIANYLIFKGFTTSQRFIDTLSYYNNATIKRSLSHFLVQHPQFHEENLLVPPKQGIIKFISYCIMPDHYHILCKVLSQGYLSKYISDVENSYTRYFNLKFKRKGPLWQSSFKSVEITTNEQLLHVSRYIHLNPTTSNLVDEPEDWTFSSYKHLVSDELILGNILTELSIRKTLAYRKFVEDRKDYQRTLRIIKKTLLEG